MSVVVIWKVVGVVLVVGGLVRGCWEVVGCGVEVGGAQHLASLFQAEHSGRQAPCWAACLHWIGHPAQHFLSPGQGH